MDRRSFLALFGIAPAAALVALAPRLPAEPESEPASDPDTTLAEPEPLRPNTGIGGAGGAVTLTTGCSTNPGLGGKIGSRFLE